MTDQEAIDELQYAIDLIKQDGKDWIDERDIPILETAIHALEKQIPRKPIEPESFSLFYKCPICKKSVNDHARYCAVCGCKLNWSEGEG